MRIGTLFSGIGAPEQAAERVWPEHEIAFACEFDKFARQSYEANYSIIPEHFHEDVHDMDGTQYKDKCDILIGGSPCQAFSIAGLRNGTEDERGQLIYQYIRIVDEVRPPAIVYENVKGMLSIQAGRTIKEFVKALREIGYHCHYDVLNTKDYGVPQNRERIFLVGFLDHDHYHRFQFAGKVKLEKRLKDVLEDDVDEKYYIDDKKFKYDGGDQLNPEYNSQGNTVYETDGVAPTLCAFTHGYAQGYFKTEQGGSDGRRLLKEGNVEVIGKLGINGRDQIKRVYDTGGSDATLTTMQGGMQEPKILQKSRGYNKGGEHEISPTLSSNSWQENNHLSEESRIRKLTPRECLRLQDFSESFKQVVSDSQLYKQAGNSMSVNVLEMIFRQIEKAQSGEPTNTLMDFT